MLSFIISVLAFIITVPLRSVIFILKTDLKRMESKGGFKSKGIISKLKGKKNNGTKKPISYKIKKRLLNYLKSLLVLFKGIAIISTIIAILVFLITFIFIIILITSVVGVIMIINSSGDGGKNSILTSNHSNNSSIEKVEKVADIDGWLDACQRTWTYNRKKGYNYIKSVKKDKEYGLIRIDCSGFVWQCLSEFGSVNKPNKGGIPCTSNFASSCKRLKDWQVISWSKSTKLEKGDILVKPGDHACIYAGNKQYYNNGSPSSSFQARKGKTAKGSYSFWEKQMGSGCYIIRLKGTSVKSVKSASTKEIIKMKDKEIWKLMSEGKYSSYEEANSAARGAVGFTKELHFWNSLLTTVKVPCWKFKDVNDISKGKKSSTVTITVNKHLKDYFKDFMTDLYNLPEKYVIYSIGGFSFRYKNNNSGTSNLSGHSFGGTLDINPQVYGMGSAPKEVRINKKKPNGDINCGHPFKKRKGLNGWCEACCCTFGSDWEKLAWDYGLYWGGHFSESYLDPMHFSLVGDGKKENRPKQPKWNGQKTSKNCH